MMSDAVTTGDKTPGDKTTGDEKLKLRTERLEFVQVDGEVVVLDSRRSLYYSVNETGGRLWTALRAGTTQTDLVRLLVEHHGVDANRARADVAAFVAQLAEAGLLDRTA
jgi:hypothetical protein